VNGEREVIYEYFEYFEKKLRPFTSFIFVNNTCILQDLFDIYTFLTRQFRLHILERFIAFLHQSFLINLISSLASRDVGGEVKNIVRIF